MSPRSAFVAVHLRICLRLRGLYQDQIPDSSFFVIPKRRRPHWVEP